VERLAGLDPAPFASMPAVKGVAADRTTGMGLGEAAWG
jgi:hypothetical protein